MCEPSRSFVLEQRLRDDFHFVRVLGNDLLGAVVGIVHQLAHFAVDFLRRRLAVIAVL